MPRLATLCASLRSRLFTYMEIVSTELHCPRLVVSPVGLSRPLTATSGKARLIGVGRYAIFDCFDNMAWLEQKIRRYEHMRWAQEPNRRTLPFVWGLEHIGGSAKEPEPRAFLDRFVEETLANSDAWYSTGAADDYELRDGVLTFT